MKITAAPYQEVHDVNGWVPRLRWIIPTDEGLLFAEDVAKHLGMTACAFRLRLRRIHWQDPRLLGPKSTPKISPAAQQARAIRLEEVRRTVAAERAVTAGRLSGLSDKPRHDRLTRIPGPGLFERAQMRGEL